MKRVLVIDDFCITGKSSMGVSFSILKSMGIEVFCIPFCFHFSKYSNNDIVDLSCNMQCYIDNLMDNKVHFDAFFVSGNFSSSQLVSINNFIDKLLKNDCQFILNLCDNNFIFNLYEDEKKSFINLCKKADVLIMDYKKANLIVNKYDKDVLYEREFAESFINILSHEYSDKVVITDFFINEKKSGIISINGRENNIRWFYVNKSGVTFCNENDIFSSVIVGYIVKKHGFEESVKLSIKILEEAVKKTLSRPDYNIYGADYESVLSSVIDNEN